MQRTAWLFTRGVESIHMSVDEQAAGGAALVIRGPGPAVATYDFADAGELTVFAQAQEQRLQGEGFQLQAIAERRGGHERRQTPRLGVLDRRQ